MKPSLRLISDTQPDANSDLALFIAECDQNLLMEASGTFRAVADLMNVAGSRKYLTNADAMFIRELLYRSASIIPFRS